MRLSFFNWRCFVTTVLLLMSFSISADQPGDWDVDGVSDTGQVEWGGWEFEYFVGNANMEGLVLKNVRYKGHKLISKASLPVVRVKYRGNEKSKGSGCGPWPDKFYSSNFFGLFTPAYSWRTIYPYEENLNDVVFYRGETSDGDPYRGIYVYGEIGGYLLWHGWNFTKSGRLEPVLYSAGWSCDDGVNRNNHRHHPYWRIDFAVDDEINDVHYVSGTNGRPVKVNKEVNLSKRDNFLGLVVASRQSNRRLLIKLEENDAQIDGEGKPWFEFSTIDAAVRLFQRKEDDGWKFGAKGELGYIDTYEPINGKDTVVWLVGHLAHDYIPGKDDEDNLHWHWSGPLIQVDNWESN